ncbi:MAG: methylenetetrahydrofolate reductase [Lachnospiraceae bacterium]|nr:methylenetetrahydrofolate reductase [Lachnospiraceae bacterium]MBQ5525193.1 methylenetetrahydrofolate reductase [Succinivibrionaceae bacterium]
MSRHPRGHFSRGRSRDLKTKFNAGTDHAITQFVFDVEAFLRFRNRCAAKGIKGEIIPLILSVSNYKLLFRT